MQKLLAMLLAIIATIATVHGGNPAGFAEAGAGFTLPMPMLYPDNSVAPTNESNAGSEFNAKFVSDFYNQLGGPIEADARRKAQPFDTFRADMVKLADEYNATDKIALLLLHNHQNVTEDELLVAEHDPVTDITVAGPTRVTANSTDDLQPRSWAFDDTGTLVSLEYEPKAGAPPLPAIQRDLLDKIYKMLVDAGLEKVRQPPIHAPIDIHQDPGQHCHLHNTNCSLLAFCRCHLMLPPPIRSLAFSSRPRNRPKVSAVSRRLIPVRTSASPV